MDKESWHTLIIQLVMGRNGTFPKPTPSLTPKLYLISISRGQGHHAIPSISYKPCTHSSSTTPSGPPVYSNFQICAIQVNPISQIHNSVSFLTAASVLVIVQLRIIAQPRPPQRRVCPFRSWDQRRCFCSTNTKNTSRKGGGVYNVREKKLGRGWARRVYYFQTKKKRGEIISFTSL